MLAIDTCRFSLKKNPCRSEHAVYTTLLINRLKTKENEDKTDVLATKDKIDRG